MPAKYKKLFAFLLLIIGPAIAGLAYIEYYGVDVVYNDHWESVPLLAKKMAGTLTVGDVFRLHNEHRIFFPEVVGLNIAAATGYNLKAMMYFGVLLTAGILGVLYASFVRAWPCGRILLWRDLALFIPAGLLLFSPRQYELFLFPDYARPFCSFSVVLSLYMLAYKIWDERGCLTHAIWCFIIALFAGVFASFSFLPGLFVWPAGAIVLLVVFYASSVRGGKAWVFGSAWCLAGVLAYVIYFRGYSSMPGHPSPTLFLTKPSNFLHYLVSHIGSPLSGAMWRSAIFGVLIIGLMLYVIFLGSRSKEILRRHIFLLSVIFVAALIAASTSIARQGFGVEQALSSRYTAANYLLIASTYLAALSLLPRRTMAIIAVLVGLSLISPYKYGLRASNGMRTQRLRMQEVLRNYEHETDERLLLLYPDAGTVRQRASFLRARHLSVFRNDSAANGCKPSR